MRYSQGIGQKFWGSSLILTSILRMFKVLARWIPRMLTEDQKRSRVDISRFLLSGYGDDPEESMDRVVIKDETWVHYFVPESKKQSIQ